MSNYSKMVRYERSLELLKATLSLFKGVPKEPNKVATPIFDNKKTLIKGFYVPDEVIENCPQVVNNEVLYHIDRLFGYNPVELNQGFYKSFSKVKNSSPVELLAKQLFHYFTTYGLESMGIRDDNLVYIPNEELNLPGDAKLVKITVIKLLEDEEIIDRIKKLINSGIAFSDKTLKDVITIIEEMKIELDIDAVPNKELRIRLCDMLKLLPKNPEEFLRYMVYKKTSSTLLIKSNDMIRNIHWSNESVRNYFDEYIRQNGLPKLAEVFYRHKNLWLAFKKESSEMASIINQMRRLADKYHKPLKPQILDTITSAKKIDFKAFEKELDKVTIFKRISLANSVLFRCSSPESISYFIRNGKTWSEKYDDKFVLDQKILMTLMNSIIKDIKPNVEGKKIYIPENFEYAMPTSEKKFYGAIPFNSYYTFNSKSAVIGVHWFNIKNSNGRRIGTNGEDRVDLDFHSQSRNHDVGWNTYIRDENMILAKDTEIIFSGDMTNAPIKDGGATEAFFVGEKLVDDMTIMTVNNYTNNNVPVPYKLILDDVKDDRVNKQYIINCHTMAFCIPDTLEVGETNKFVGFLESDEEGNKKFCFTSGSLSRSIVAKFNESADHTVNAMKTTIKSCLKLRDVLKQAGAVLEKAEDEEWDINLDPQEVDKDTLISLFVK